MNQMHSILNLNLSEFKFQILDFIIHFPYIYINQKPFCKSILHHIDSNLNEVTGLFSKHQTDRVPRIFH